jgi:hypothetical protein
MSSDIIAKSFLATLTYENDKDLDKYGNRNRVNLDFSYSVVDHSESRYLSDDSVLSSKDTEYLCANTLAPSAALLYFRYETYGVKTRYRIWVRSGPYTGRILAMLNNGYLYANPYDDHPQLFWLVVKPEGENQAFQYVTGDNMPAGQFLLQQADTATQLTVSLGETKPDSTDPTTWWSYVTATQGSQERFIRLNIKETNVDYAPTDGWGKGSR